MAKDLSEDSQLSSDALYAANMIVNTLRRSDPTSVGRAKLISTEFFSRRSLPNTAHTAWTARHVVTAVGNCHIDTAWLWPYAETKRKVARSFATQLSLMDKYPEYVFTASQAQQFAWLEEGYPDLFRRVVEKATAASRLGPVDETGMAVDESFASKTQQFVPIGGTHIRICSTAPSNREKIRLDGTPILTHFSPADTYVAQGNVKEISFWFVIVSINC
ncbi:hypothetical protein HK405_012115 [Cladochytrium tenue]|nr:hypothetical protein HK405_012115 [Cladochytrium tenue]